MADNGVALIDSLAAGLTPVRRRTAWRDGMAFAALAVVEVAVYLALRGMRPDMPVAMGHMAFWWKAVSLLVLAVIGVATTIAALDPARSPRRGLRSLAVAAAVAVAVGWGVDAARGGSASLIARLDWRDGLDCIAFVIGCALPALGALALLMRRGASTDPRGAATAAGAAAAAWGGVVFTLDCPHDDPFYIAVWFAAAIAIVMVIARLILPRLTRW
ncbi:MAG: DUF1109 family protein [Sphingomonadaceae bacterium]|nr:DUF1109 family protein [Sphingomonadaceae bacterium]